LLCGFLFAVRQFLPGDLSRSKVPTGFAADKNPIKTQKKTETGLTTGKNVLN